MEAVEKSGSFRPVFLKELIRSIIPDAEYEARQQNSHITFLAGDECVITGNRELLYRAIENVVRNVTIRYTEPPARELKST